MTVSKKGRFGFPSRVAITVLVNFSAIISHTHAQIPIQAFPTNTNLDECHSANIPCGGHTQPSCMRYCKSAGFTTGTCDGMCCLCSNIQTGQQGTMYDNTAYFNLGSSQTGGVYGLFTGRRIGNPYNELATVTSRPLKSTLQVLQRRANASYGNTVFFNMGGGYNLAVGGGTQAIILHPNGLGKDPYLNQIAQKPVQKPLSKPKPSKPTITASNSAYFQKPNNKFPPVSKHDVCMSSTCYDESRIIKGRMNQKVDPCDDFYQFACGGYSTGLSIPNDATEVTHFSVLRDKVASQLRKLFEESIRKDEAKPFKLIKTMYRSCMNTKLIESQGWKPLVKVLDELGGWPVLEGNKWQPHDEFKWENLLVWNRELGFGLDYFMKISVEPDLRDVGKRRLTIGEPSSGVSEHVLKKGLNEPAVNAYYEFMTETAILMGADKIIAKQEMLDAVNLEIGMAQCRLGRHSTFYNPMTIHQLSIKYSFIPWLSLFQRLVPEKISITDQEVIMVSVPQYIDCFFDLLRKTEQKTMVNYAIWRAIAGAVTYLHEPARALQQNFVSKLTGQKDRKPRWKECGEIVQINMGNAVGAMYVRRYFNDASKAQAMEMVKNIQSAFLEILNENTWMDSFTKERAREKALEMAVHIGYPEEQKSDSKITPIYEGFNFKEDDYFGNILNLITGSFKIQFGKLRDPIRRNDWLAHGQNAIVNAFYQPQENSIQFPAAILQGHFFNATRPKYLNYAAIGWIMGHEITHAFDDQGSQFDKHGNHLNWWAESTKQTYNQKKQCIIDQYSSFQAQGLRLNGDRGQGENIADNGGIKQAYRGYSYWTAKNGQEKILPGMNYTPKQLFWISAAQNWCSLMRAESLHHSIVTGVHSPPEFRVRGTFANSVEFAKDFKCSPGRKMNPTRKCSVW